jgi:hypothetical protein
MKFQKTNEIITITELEKVKSKIINKLAYI